MNQQRITFAVSNDISHDQRMHRICRTLAQAGCDVTLVGRLRSSSTDIGKLGFKTYRIKCYFNFGFFFYAEFNLRLLFYLLQAKTDAISAVDLDTLLACRTSSKLRGLKLYFDAHEIFTEVPELTDRNLIKKIWAWIGHLCINPQVSCYTVNDSLAKILSKKYNVPFVSVYNYPIQSTKLTEQEINGPVRLLYQGMVNRGRGVLEAIEAIKDQSSISLDIIGDGDIIEDVRVQAHRSTAKINLLDFVSPNKLTQLTSHYHIGLNLLDSSSDNYYYSSANKFYDYIMAGLPMITMDFPEYNNIIHTYEVGVPIANLDAHTILAAIERIKHRYAHYRNQCLIARKELRWSREESKLLAIYSSELAPDEFR